MAVTSFVVGFGDSISFGLAEAARESLAPGSSCQVIKDGFYTAGGLASSFVPIPGLGVAAAAFKVGAVAVAGAATVVIKAIPAAVTAAKGLPKALIGGTVMAAKTTTSAGGRVGSRSTNAASCLANSFVPGTKVLMADGSARPIEEIEVGDAVWSADPETGEAGARRVTALIEGSGKKNLVTVTTVSGVVVATAGHLFWDPVDEQWVDAGDLTVGDALLEADGATSLVTAVSAVSGQATVHNLTVADIHTYFVIVGDAPTLVHNASCGVGPNIDDARFAQNSFREAFGDGGQFAGRTIDDVAGSLRTGIMSADDVPINVIVREGNTLILNTRSAQALIRANVPRSGWNIVNQTGNPLFEGLLSNQLRRNGLTSEGTAF